MILLKKTNKIALSSNDDKKMQSIDSIETYVYGINKDVVCKKEEIKCTNIKKQSFQEVQEFLTIHAEYS